MLCNCCLPYAYVIPYAYIPYGTAIHVWYVILYHAHSVAITFRT